MKRTEFQFFTLILLLLVVGGFANGQSDRATITGTVTDPTGGVLPGAQAQVTQTGTGATYTGSANKVGIYTIPGLPVGTYSLTISRSGFKDFTQTGIILIAAQVLQVNVHMTVGSSTQTVTVTGGAPLLETETSTVSMTMEESALRDLPLNATNGRDAMNLMLATTPAVNTSQGGQAGSGTQNWNIFAGGQTMTNSVYVDGMESTAGDQGQIITPGLDALQEVQVQTLATDAEFGTGGGVELFQLKSGTHQFHGSAFEFLQNEALNANTWSNNYFLSQCAPSDTTCIQDNARARDRFNDFGVSAGGPVWKVHNTYIFGDYERYNITDDRLNPNAETVPTAQMLTGDFSQLLTGGTNQGTILTSSGVPWINPCTGQPYQYGQIFDPQTQKIVNGATCATPFSGNIIPSSRLSSQSQKIAAIYSQYYKPTLTSRIYDNFPSQLSGTPEYTKTTYDLKVDHNFSELHHLSVSFDAVDENGPGLNGGFDYLKGPFSSWFSSSGVQSLARIIDNYSITPNLLNILGIGYSRQPSSQQPEVKTNPTTYGFDAANGFPVLEFGNASNGVGVTSDSTAVSAYADYNAFHYQDTVIWNKGRHNFKFGGTFVAQQLNASFGGNIQTYEFATDTGGPTDPGLTPFVGSGFATAMLGDVQSASVNVTQSEYPRQKLFALFVQDDYRATPKLTLNLGLRWDVTLRGHEQAGRWQNFDLTAQNPLWGSYPGAWVFSKNSGTTFETNEDYHQFGPRLGGAYQLSNKLVVRAAYALFYVPLGAFSSGYGPYFPANQTFLAFPVNEVNNNVVGSTAFNWDGGYPGVSVLSPQNSTATNMGTGTGGNYPMYIHPDILHLGYTQNWHIGTQYEMSKNILLNLYYMANRGLNLHDDGRSIYHNYPDFGTYHQVLLAGNINTQISNAGEAAAAGVPYPYPNFSGPAFAAIAPFPQAASYDSGFPVMSFGNPADSAVSAFNAFVAEVKARNAKGLYLDFSYTLSKMTGSAIGLDGFANNWSYPAQNLADWQDAKHWVQNFDQRHLAKGYATYLLPFGKNRMWLSGSSRLLNLAVGGWELGYYGSYGSGTPLGPVESTYQLPFFFSTQRGNFSPGQSANNLSNHFSGHLNLTTLTAPSNTDFNRNLFTTTSAAAPFGDTPYTFNHWRWNPGVAQENLSAMKHFRFGPGNHLGGTISAQFFNVFNRHYIGAPDLNMNDTTFGNVTGLATPNGGTGNRTGQLSARVEW